MHSISEHAVIRKRVGGRYYEEKNEMNKHTNRCLLSYTRMLMMWWGRFFEANNEKSIESMDKCFLFCIIFFCLALIYWRFFLSHIPYKETRNNIRSNGSISLWMCRVYFFFFFLCHSVQFPLDILLAVWICWLWMVLVVIRCNTIPWIWEKYYNSLVQIRKGNNGNAR